MDAIAALQGGMGSGSGHGMSAGDTQRFLDVIAERNAVDRELYAAANSAVSYM